MFYRLISLTLPGQRHATHTVKCVASTARNRHTLPERSITRYNGSTMETWRPVVGCDFYDVSSLGRVRSWRKKGRTIRKRHDEPRVMRQRLDKDGYPRITLCVSRVMIDRAVHHLVLEAFVGLRKKGLETRHLDGNPANNRLENLKWGTSLENSADAVRHGTRPRRKTLASKG